MRSNYFNPKILYVYTLCTLLLWSAIGCLMLAKISSFLFSIVEAAEHTYDFNNKGCSRKDVWVCENLNSIIQGVS